MTDTHIAKLMWDAYAIQAGGKTFDGKPLPTWDELGEDRQSCWVAAASVTASRIEMLEAALQRANATAEEYERKFYLGSDRIEKLEAALREIINKDTFGMDWAIRTAREALEGKDD
jgi:hypothetical protein